MSKYRRVTQCCVCGKIYPKTYPEICYRCGTEMFAKPTFLTSPTAKNVIARRRLFGWQIKNEEYHKLKRGNTMWNKTIEKLPPEDVVVETKIHDDKGWRNNTKLKRKGNLWFLPDGSMHVYYTPTHWRFVRESLCWKIKKEEDHVNL